MFINRFEELKTLISSCICSKGASKMTSDYALGLVQMMLTKVKKEKGLIYLIGNGGSAGIASHFAADFMRTLKIGATTLTDPSMISCFANDMGYENSFSYPFEKMVKKGDLLIAISSSGKSSNIINAAEIARLKEIPLITFSGFSESNLLRTLGDLNFWVKSFDYGLVETAHFFLLHTIVDAMSGAFPKSLKEELVHAP